MSLTKTEEQLNHLCWDCSGDYGRISYTLEQADPSTVGQFRLRDLFILQATKARLANMDDEKAISSLMIHAAHMNTYEGQLACLDLVDNTFNSAASLTSRIRQSVNEKYRTAWESRFGINLIRDDEFALDTTIPSVRPLPAYKSKDGLTY